MTWCTVLYMNDERKLSITPNVDRVLMSDTLKGQVPELDDENVTDFDEIQSHHVIVVADKIVNNQRTGLVGVLRGLTLGAESEIQFRIDLDEALDIIDAPGLAFGGFELCHGEKKSVKIQGPFNVKSARLEDISVQDQLCTLGLHLVKQAR